MALAQLAREESTAIKSSRLPALDFLRGIAILLVLGRHHPVTSTTTNIVWRWPAAIWLRIGWTGVDLFFVLSGFLIGGLLCREMQQTGGIEIRRFLWRRGYKIWPSYYFYLVCLALVMTWDSGQGIGALGHIVAGPLLPSIFNVQNYFTLPRLHLWSLAVEEHFYLLLPVFMWCLSKRFHRTPAFGWIPIAAIGSMVICTYLRVADVHAGKPWPYVEFATHLRLDGLAFGVLLAYVYHFQTGLWAKLCSWASILWPAGCLMVAAAALPKFHPYFMAALGFPLLYIGYGACLLALLAGHSFTRWMLRGVIARGVIFTGVSSYSIYLWHNELGVRPIAALHRVWALPGPLEWPLMTLLYVLLSVVAGTLGSRAIEWPLLRIRDRRIPSQYSAT